jgi:hypothetical protein
MADYAISNVPRRVVYAPSGVGPYAFTFEILDQTDIAVYKASTLLTLTTDYTVTINANGTGSVTLVTTAGTSNITIVGAKNIQRTTDFTTGGDLFANTLNDELDNQTIFIQQVAETAERGLKAPVTDPTDIAMSLPAKADRANKYLGFDSNGNPVASSGTGANIVSTAMEPVVSAATLAAGRSNLGLAIGTNVQAYSAQLQSYANDGVAMRNRIINGAMVIDQRNAGASVTVDSTSAFFAVDRWKSVGQSTDGVYTVQQVSDAPAGFSYSLKATVTTADASVGASEFYNIFQMIEGFNWADLNWGTANAKTVTYSFWVKSSLTGTMGGSLYNSSANYSYPFTYTISAANTWEYKTITIVGPTAGTWVGATNGTGVNVNFSIGDGSNRLGTAGAWTASTATGATGQTQVISTLSATIQWAGVQLEVGTQATSFEYRQYQQELALCQRYLPAFNAAGSTAGSIGTGGFFSTTEAALGIPFPVTTRVAPTGITISNAADFTVDGLTSASCTAVTFSNASTTMAGVNITYNDTTTSGSFGRMRYNVGTAQMLFTGCEL